MSFVAMNNAYLETLVEELASRGIRRAALPSRSGADVSPPFLAECLRRAVELTGDPAFAIAYGRRLNLVDLGQIGRQVAESIAERRAATSAASSNRPRFLSDTDSSARVTDAA